MQPSPSFSLFRLPTGQTAWIPEDIQLRLPDTSMLAPADLHYLIYIPWDEKYLAFIDPAYREFFQMVLPYLHVRTTDVHVATCLSFIKELIQAEQGTVDERVATIAFILHDSGWSQMSEKEIAESLGVQGLSLAGHAIQPKARHAILGQEVARKLLGEHPFWPPLSAEQKDWIYKAILFHDRPQELAGAGGIPASIIVVCNVDHLWSFTHANFWQDTVRKGVRPDVYLENLGEDLAGYFVSQAGRQKARQFLEERGLEVQSWKEWIKRN